MKIGIIGCGNMGGAILKALVTRLNIKPELVAVSDISSKKLKAVSRKFRGINTTRDNLELVDFSEVIIIAVKPQDISQLLSQLKMGNFNKKLIITIAAGIGTRYIESVLGRIPVVRVMPNTPLLVGEGMAAIFKGRYANRKHMAIAKRIFQSAGKVIVVDTEDAIDRVTAVSGSGPAYVYYFIESMIKSALKLGFDKSDAEKLVFQTYRGSLELLFKMKLPPEILRQAVTSKGGTTEAAIRCFDRCNLQQYIFRGIKLAYKRAKELSK